MRIGELADETGVTPKTLRFYERAGVLPEPARTPAGYRDYGPEAAHRIRFVRRAQAAGLTLREIAVVAAIEEGTGRGCEHALRFVDEVLVGLEQRIGEVDAARDEFRNLRRDLPPD